MNRPVTGLKCWTLAKSPNAWKMPKNWTPVAGATGGALELTVGKGTNVWNGSEHMESSRLTETGFQHFGH